jgi:hypothetical protein
MKQRTPYLILFILLALSISLPAAATSYKWDDSQGNLHVVNRWDAVPVEYHDAVTIIPDGVIDHTAPDNIDQTADQAAPSFAIGSGQPSTDTELDQKMGFFETLKRIYWTLNGEMHPDFFEENPTAAPITLDEEHPSSSNTSGATSGTNAGATSSPGAALPPGYGSETGAPGEPSSLPPGMTGGARAPGAAGIARALGRLPGEQKPLSSMSARQKMGVFWRAAKRSGLHISVYVMLGSLAAFIGLFIFSFKISSGSIRWFTRIIVFIFVMGGGSVVTMAMSLPLIPQFTTALAEEMAIEIKNNPPAAADPEIKSKSITDGVRENVERSLQKGYERSTNFDID